MFTKAITEFFTCCNRYKKVNRIAKINDDKNMAPVAEVDHVCKKILIIDYGSEQTITNKI